MFKIAIANEKGGVAKTTSAISIAACLSEQKCKVSLMDLDPQANLTIALGLDPTDDHMHALKSFSDFQFLETLIQNTEYENITYIPVNTMTVTEGNDANSDMLMLHRLMQLSPDFCEFLIIDCPPQLGWITRNALSAADLLVIPTQAEYFSIYALKTMIQMIKNIRDNGNPNLTYKLLLTMFDRRNRIHQKMMEELRDTFGVGVFETYIEIDTKLRESQVTGTPIVFHSPSSRASVQYRALTQEIIDYAKTKNI